MHVKVMRRKGATHLFESSWKRPYSERGIRKMIARYGKQSGLKRRVSPSRKHRRNMMI
jgi:integrase/recombinase XerD